MNLDGGLRWSYSYGEILVVELTLVLTPASISARAVAQSALPVSINQAYNRVCVSWFALDDKGTVQYAEVNTTEPINQSLPPTVRSRPSR
jgi:hypothetical protein